MSRARADAQSFGLTFTEVDSADHAVRPGNWLVALVHFYIPGLFSQKSRDVHWYRKHDDGSWWHKPGKTSITNREYFGEDENKQPIYGSVILNPETCSRGQYNNFLGFYEVGPN